MAIETFNSLRLRVARPHRPTSKRGCRCIVTAAIWKIIDHLSSSHTECAISCYADRTRTLKILQLRPPGRWDGPVGAVAHTRGAVDLGALAQRRRDSWVEPARHVLLAGAVVASGSLNKRAFAGDRVGGVVVVVPIDREVVLLKITGAGTARQARVIGSSQIRQKMNSVQRVML